MKGSKPFVHPTYPPPYDDWPSCCYVPWEAEWAALRQVPWSLARISEDRDPYGEKSLGYAQRALQHFRDRVGSVAYSNRVADYPSPFYLQKLAHEVCGSNYGALEVDVGHLFEWLLGLVVSLVPLRAFVVAHLRNGQDPTQAARKICRSAQEQPIRDLDRYLLGIARRMGENPPDESREGEGPIRPDLSGDLAGWDPTPPRYDQDFENETRRLVEGDPSFAEALETTGVGRPTVSSDEWLGSIRATIAPARARAKAAKSGR